ncbi:MAG: hypothetical protein H3Z53_09565 [archaeon]|nr:hypothetical protein [archaeon]MCP8314600.1 hypothetical protein [archaeon]MCP8317351.1 hypothetical protein [archaeon]MCP8319651.1 hypothetical protein [archaeon]
MRVLFKSKEEQKRFFRSAKSNLLTWKQLYHLLLAQSKRHFTLRSFQNWYKGFCSPAYEVANAICKLTHLDLRSMDIEIVDNNWGQRIGGKSKFEHYGCQLTLEERRLAGRKTGSSNTLEHLVKISSSGGVASVKSKTNFKRKVIGPRGEMMFNKLEQKVAMILLKIGVNYNYEKVFRVSNNHVIPDFVVGNVLIECTYDTRVDWKARRIIERFEPLLSWSQKLRLIVITTDKLKPRYCDYLNGFAPVLKASELHANFFQGRQ